MKLGGSIATLNSKRTFPSLVLRLPLCKMFALLQHHDLWLLVPVVFVCTPLLIVRTLRNSWSARDGWATGTVVLILIVIVVVVVPSAASRPALHPLEERGDLRLICESRRELGARRFFRHCGQ